MQIVSFYNNPHLTAEDVVVDQYAVVTRAEFSVNGKKVLIENI